MKKLFTLFAIALLGVSTWSCSYDDDDLWSAVDDLDSRMEAVEKAVKSANTDIDALQTLVEALQANVTVVSVVQNADGYVITFSDGKTATITNGKDGLDAPAISVKKDDDGIYYWTLNGDYLTDAQGNKIKAEGKDGTDGSDGSDGTDGITPQLKIEDGYWYLSSDNGATWTQLGKATGENGQDGTDGTDGTDGKDGDSMFESVDTTSNPGFAVFTLIGGSKIEIPMQGALSLTISKKSGLFIYDEEQTFTITGKGVGRMTFTKPDGWKVSIEGSTLTVKAPAKANSYAETKGTIALIGMAGNYSCMAEMTVSALEHSHTITFEGADWTKWVACNYAPGKYSTTQLGSPDEYAWVDETTQFTTGRPTGFMGGWGYPWFVCSYNSNSLNQSKYGNYSHDLYLYNPDGAEDSMTGGGRNGSDNFLTTYGYLDFDYPYGDGRPIFTFADGKARTIKSLYVNSTCYFYSVAMDGNGLSPALTKDVTYYATGYDAEDNELKTITMTFATPEAVTKTWTEWDLTELGEIVSLRLNQAGGADNGYGYSLPAYYAVDDVTVVW